MTKRFLTVIAFLALAGTAGLAAQSNELIDEIIAQNPVQFGNAAYLILTASGKIPETATVDEAATYALDQKWGLRSQAVGDPLALDQVALLIMKSLELRGGVFYSLFPSPRYALRELNFLRIAAKPNWPDKPVAGDEVMRMLTKAMALKEHP